jgi:hypothetical protein
VHAGSGGRVDTQAPLIRAGALSGNAVLDDEQNQPSEDQSNCPEQIQINTDATQEADANPSSEAKSFATIFFCDDVFIVTRGQKAALGRREEERGDGGSRHVQDGDEKGNMKAA